MQDRLENSIILKSQSPELICQLGALMQDSGYGIPRLEYSKKEGGWYILHFGPEIKGDDVISMEEVKVLNLQERDSLIKLHETLNYYASSDENFKYFDRTTLSVILNYSIFQHDVLKRLKED